jgi:hypothetical protein
MLLRTDPRLIKGVCEFYPESKEERDLIMKLSEYLGKKNESEIQFEFENDSESMSLIIYRQYDT